MSKELDAIDTYIDQQQKVLNDTVQKNLLLETKISLLEKQVKDLSDINKKNEETIISLQKTSKDSSEQKLNLGNIVKNLFKKKKNDNVILSDSKQAESVIIKTEAVVKRTRKKLQRRLSLKGFQRCLRNKRLF